MAPKRSRSGNVGLYGRRLAEDPLLVESLDKSRFSSSIIDRTSQSFLKFQAVIIGLDDFDDIATSAHEVRARFPSAALIGFTRQTHGSPMRMVEAFRAGLSDAVVAEEGVGDLIATIKLGIEKKRIESSVAQLSTSFTRELGERTRQLQDAFHEIEHAYEDTLHALVGALDTREKATAGHSLRVAHYCCYLAHLLGVSDAELLDVYRGALLHDIGKIGIPDAILLKPAKLNDEEWIVMRRHTEIGLSFLKGISYLANAVDIPYCHHEKWNGTGYPQQLSGEAIPLSARIFAVVDVFDALRSKRSYKESFGYEKSVEMVLEGSGSHFDPDVIDVFRAQKREAWDALDLAAQDTATFETVLAKCREVRMKWCPELTTIGSGV